MWQSQRFHFKIVFQVRWLMPVILALDRVRQEEGSKFETSLEYIVLNQPELRRKTLSKQNKQMKNKRTKKSQGFFFLSAFAFLLADEITRVLNELTTVLLLEWFENNYVQYRIREHLFYSVAF